MSKHGIPKLHAALKGGVVNLPILSSTVRSVFQLARDGKAKFSNYVEATNVHDLKHKLVHISLGPNQHFVGFRVRGDRSSLPPLSSAFPGDGDADLDVLELNVYKAITLAYEGVLDIGTLYQADDQQELHALAGSINLSAHDDAFLGFVRTEN